MLLRLCLKPKLQYFGLLGAFNKLFLNMVLLDLVPVESHWVKLHLTIPYTKERSKSLNAKQALVLMSKNLVRAHSL